jgi:hypothetical protein
MFHSHPPLITQNPSCHLIRQGKQVAISGGIIQVSQGSQGPMRAGPFLVGVMVDSPISIPL